MASCLRPEGGGCDRAQEGTPRFYRVATAYVTLNGLRLTLAVHFALPEETIVSVLEALLNRVMALAFFLRNVWLHLRWLFTRMLRRGCRWLDTRRFQLGRLAKFVARALERHYGCVHEIVASAPPGL